MPEEIKCAECGKIIPKRNFRTLCIAYVNKRNKELSKIYREAHREEIREKNRERARMKYRRLKLVD